jgi:hypothetical protein
MQNLEKARAIKNLAKRPAGPNREKRGRNREEQGIAAVGVHIEMTGER